MLNMRCKFIWHSKCSFVLYIYKYRCNTHSFGSYWNSSLQFLSAILSHDHALHNTYLHVNHMASTTRVPRVTYTHARLSD